MDEGRMGSMTMGVEGTEWSEVLCPHCGAPPGAPCMSGNGNPARPHSRRLLAARDSKAKGAITAPVYDTPESVAEKCKTARAVGDRFAELFGGRKP
jgi:hypothetical protein